MAVQKDPDPKAAGFLVRVARAFFAIACAGWSCIALSSSLTKFDFDIEPGPIARELEEFSSLAVASIAYDANLTRAGHGVHGRYSVEEALTRILRNTGLTCVKLHGGAVFVVRSSTRTDRERQGRCQNVQQHAEAEEGPAPVTQDLPLVYVRGIRIASTYLQESSQVESALITWNDAQIRSSGASDLSDLLSEMTQNFGGGPNQFTHHGQVETYTNTGLGSSLNLRGLGARSTQILLDGRPIAPSGSSAAFVDLLNIPLSAVKRVEVLTDDTSAVYGLDAVGGTVNILTKDQYTGGETLAEIGSVTNGHQKQHRFSQDLGTSWDSGTFLVNAEIMQRGALGADERWQNRSDLSPFDLATLTPGASNPLDPYAGSDIVPNQMRSSLFTSFRQSVGGESTLFGDLFWTQRRALERDGELQVNPFLVYSPQTLIVEGNSLLEDLGPQITTVTVRTLNAALGLDIHLAPEWRLTLTGSESLETENRVATGQADVAAALQAAVSDPDKTVTSEPSGAEPHTPVSTFGAVNPQQWYGSRSEIRDFAATAEGPLLLSLTEPWRAAMGIEYRDQRFSTAVSGTPAGNVLQRQLRAAFIELVVPTLSPTTFPAPWRALTLSLAGRIEDSSDFGEAAAPRVGLTWKPVTHVALSSTWARSIRLPNLGDLSQRDNVSYIQSSGGIPALIWTGGNAHLSAEHATTRTIGLKFESDESSRLTADIHYFDILSRNRIQPSDLATDALTNPAYASFVTLTPSALAVNAVCDQSRFIGAGACPQVPIEAIVDLREHNAATLWTNGIDLRLGSRWETAFGDWSVSLAGTYILHYKEADTPNEPLVSLLNTLSNPLALHATASSTWRIGKAETALDVRYSSPYRNLQTQPATRVASWTTANLHFAYTFNNAVTPESSRTEVALMCKNVLNHYSPFAVNTVAGLGYDQENGDLTGRTLTLSLHVKW